MNSASVIRLSDNRVIEVLGISANLDKGNWAWRFSLTVADRDSLDAIKPSARIPVEIRITVNGHQWDAMVVDWGLSRRYGQRSYTAGAISLSGYLGAPWSAVRSREVDLPKTAEQLALKELENTGFSLTWGTADWEVPGGAFSYQDLTPIQAVSRISNAAGALLQPTLTGKGIQVVTAIPAAPWHWDAQPAAATLPDSILKGLGVKPIPGTGVDGIFLSGVNKGILAQLTRDGTAGNNLAPMIADALFTDTLVAQQRGIVIFADALDREEWSVSLPLTAPGDAPGLLLPGQLVEATVDGESFKSAVTGCQVSASRVNRRLGVTQTLSLMRYYP